jgi:hypothetical protein
VNGGNFGGFGSVQRNFCPLQERCSSRCCLPLAAQDIRGVELCTAETRMDRRTGCLQANVEFLQQSLIKLARETQDKMTAADRTHGSPEV